MCRRIAAPTPGLNQDEQAESARVRLLHSYLTAAAERTPESRASLPPEFARAAASTPPRRSAAREPAAHDADTDNEPLAPVEPTLGLQSTALPARDPIERRTQVEQVRKFGIIALLDWPELKDPKRRYERHMTGEELTLMDRLFNPESAPVYEGPGGLALSGTGIGGGGKANVVLLGAVRTVAEGEGDGLERFPEARIDPAARTPRTPPLRQRESIVSDPLAAASIRRAVHAERTALRGCYADALGSGSAGAMGAMGAMVRFVVQGNGQIEQVSATDPSLPATVSSCIERVFIGLSVPNPVSRPVHVAYRLALDS